MGPSGPSPVDESVAEAQWRTAGDRIQALLDTSAAGGAAAGGDAGAAGGAAEEKKEVVEEEEEEMEFDLFD